LAGDAAPDAGGQVIVDIDGILVLAHCEKQDAAATWKKTFGHHMLMGFVEHGRSGSGEPGVGLLRLGSAGSNTAADHIEATKLALAQLPKRLRRGRQTLIRTDSSGGTHEFVAWLAQRGRWLSYSVGMTITDAIHQAVLKVPASAWTLAVEPDCDIRDCARVAELAGDCPTGWPASPPIRRARRSPPSNCATGNGPAPRTASAPPAPSACATSPSTRLIELVHLPLVHLPLVHLTKGPLRAPW
jgi:hypothetical protein